MLNKYLKNMSLKRSKIMNLPGCLCLRPILFLEVLVAHILACSSTIGWYLAAVVPTSSQGYVWRENNKKRTER